MTPDQLTIHYTPHPTPHTPHPTPYLLLATSHSQITNNDYSQLS
ncbi:hypothetical protein [Scytonema millei]|nr:hypothetical protein [Scytonema millei]